MENWFTPSIPSVLPTANRILVLAPHADDEIFGCGGTLALYREMGAEIHVHVLTDGAAYAPDEQREEIARLRYAESNRALAVLGLSAASHAGFRDRGLASLPTLITHLAELIALHRPQLIMAPSLWEIHPDHLAVGRAVCGAISASYVTEAEAPKLAFYEIGAPLRCNCLIDVSSVWERKMEAMNGFPSQLAQQDYVRHISALNTYRTYTLPAAVRYAEAFILLTAAEICRAERDGMDPIGRHMGRWVESALSAAEANCETVQFMLAKKERELIELERKLIHATVALAGANTKTEIADRECMVARKQLADIQESSSWQLTAPLRWFAGKLKR